MSGYQSGFGNQFETEALPGALPVGRNSPQRCAYGLYAEQINGTSFTAPRAANRRSWLYRIKPTVANWGRFRPMDAGLWRTAPCNDPPVPPMPMRWDPIPLPDGPVGFPEGVRTITTAGDAGSLTGMASHIYVLTRSMRDEYFYNADGEMMFVPQFGSLRLRTELGVIVASPGDLAVVPRGIKFCVELVDRAARGYLLENYGASLTLPERGPIGANGSANPRDFLAPVAAYEDRSGPCRLMVKWGGALWQTDLDRSPLDVVAWHGNHVPYKYDLRRFCPMGPISFDHADPSIFCTMTSPTDTPGTSNIDFVIFPERWLVAEDTFRPPWYHMNVMAEFMGLISGVYDAKTGGGFEPGGFSLHNTMLPHGPDRDAFEKASSSNLAPQKLEGTLAFMFETRLPQKVTAYAAGLPGLQAAYGLYGTPLETHFNAGRR